MDAPDLNDLIPLPQVWERLDRVEKRLIEASRAQDAFLTEIAQHGMLAGGKRFRPLLAQLTAEFGPNLDHRAIDAGAAVELIHLGSLYHDDVIDEATTRRGVESVNSNWSNTVAILAGDFLMARASEVAAATLGQEAVQLLARTYAELVEGQTLELQLDHDLGHGPAEYYRVIGGKTASLIRTSARLGAMATDASAEVIEAVSAWAWELGMVFQITDDALDLVATEGYLGKPAGSDIGEGKFTLPVLLALAGGDGARTAELLATRPPYPDSLVKEVIDLVRSGGYVDRALEEAATRVETAQQAVAGLPDGDAKDILGKLGSYLLGRVQAARTAP